MDDDEEESQVTEKTFVVGRNQEYYESEPGVTTVGYVYHGSKEYKAGLRSGMSVTSAGPIHDGKREITVITHVNSGPQGSDVSYGGGKRKKRKYSKKSTKRKYKKKGSKKRRKSKKKTKRRR